MVTLTRAIYPLSMPTVYVTGKSNLRKFHRSPDCRELTKRTCTSVKAVDLVELDLPTPCRRCYPDAPRAESVHLYCPQHKSYRPCQHNGGVLAEVPMTMSRQTLCFEPGDVIIRHMYVWPESARHYVVV